MHTSPKRTAFLSPRKPYFWGLTALTVIAIILAAVLGSVLPQQHSRSMAAPATSDTGRPRAVVYNGAAASENCPEAVGALLSSSKYKFAVQYVDRLQANTLDGVSIYAFPGGPDQEEAFNLTQQNKPIIQKFVAGGGRYLGFCLGAYMADHDEGYGLVPNGTSVDSEIERANSEVRTDDDTTIAIDYTFQNQTEATRRQIYFQEGAFLNDFDPQAGKGKVLARYAKSGDVAASVSAYGQGWVGLIGPHPEADESWFTDAEVPEPKTGLSFDIGWDFIAQTMDGVSA